VLTSLAAIVTFSECPSRVSECLDTGRLPFKTPLINIATGKEWACQWIPLFLASRYFRPYSSIFALLRR
jgi:hypothetical protein